MGRRDTRMSISMAARRIFLPCAAVLIVLAVHARASVQPANLAATVAANVVLQQQQHAYLNVLHETQDAWTYQKDANTLKAYALRNLLNQNLAMANAKVYYGDLRDRLTRRNSQLNNWNMALNSSVQLNERIEKFTNQSNCLLDDQTEALDAQNVALLNDIGVLRTREDPRTFGLTLARQESVHRKLSEKITWEKVEEISLAHRALKETFAQRSHRLWGEKRDLDTKNDHLEAYIPTLKMQRDLQQAIKLSETWKKRTEETRRTNYADQVPALEASRNALFATLKRLRIDNQKLREHKGHVEMQRASIRQDLLLQKTGEIDSLLQKNAANEHADKMTELYNAARVERDALLHESRTATHTSHDKEHDAILCQEHNRELSKDIAYLTHQNNVLVEHCTAL